ncbi:hypothetical protein [Aeromonas caviae]|uniref:hypothetical protein n=1 Tax=Aeromonas caviae TaxID=648 RepID=UPI002B46A9BD|nr:hypothetical protein [Aeromonas caviae]
MIESSIFECLKMNGFFDEVHPFKVPDNTDPKKTAITFMRLGTRINTRYYASETMKQQLDKSSFLCSITNPKYFVMIEEFSKLQGHIANYQDDLVLQMEVESYDDFESSMGQYVREFTITVLHKTNLT